MAEVSVPGGCSYLVEHGVVFDDPHSAGHAISWRSSTIIAHSPSADRDRGERHITPVHPKPRGFCAPYYRDPPTYFSLSRLLQTG